MPRVLDAERNMLEVEDRISDSILTIFYRRPNNAERVSYSNEMTIRKGGKVRVVKDVYGVQVKYGARLLTGIKTGDFIHGGKAFASDASDPAYDPEWKQHMLAGADDVLAYLARMAFGSVDRPDGDIFEDLDKPDDPVADSDEFTLEPADPAAGEAVAAGDPLSGR